MIDHPIRAAAREKTLDPDSSLRPIRLDESRDLLGLSAKAMTDLLRQGVLLLDRESVLEYKKTRDYRNRPKYKNVRKPRPKCGLCNKQLNKTAKVWGGLGAKLCPKCYKEIDARIAEVVGERESVPEEWDD